MEYYVDFAAQSGFPYMLLDAGWADGRDITKLRGNVDVPELVRYAAAKHVKVWIWLYSTSVMEQMKEAFPLYEKWGVAGVKIDFINRDDQDGIKFYYDVAREAAEHHLMVDFHGASKPWGIERTYPNVLSYEAVLGAENSKVARRDSPVDRSVFPFTRMVAGPLDYTPGGFNNVTEDEFVGRDTSRYIAQVYQDGADAGTHPKHVTINRVVVHKGERLTLRLASGGGCAIRFIPENGR